MVGLLCLKHLYKLSDEQLVSCWLVNPYWQNFYGESHFQTEWPIDPSFLTRYCQRIEESGCVLLLQQTIATDVVSSAVRKAHLKRVTVVTAVQEKAVSFPTDSKLLNCSRQRLVRRCHQHGGGFVKVMRVWVRGACIEPAVMAMPGKPSGCAARFAGCTLVLDGWCASMNARSPPMSWRWHASCWRRKNSSKKLYSLHAPEVEWISKDKAYQRY